MTDQTNAAPISGYVAPGLETIREAFAANFAEDLELGASFCVMRKGEVLVNLVGGWRDRAKKALWDEETLVPIYSTTKPIAALMVAHAIAEYADITYGTPVSEIWPEFGAAGKAHLTIAEVMSHQAGLCGFAEPIDPALWLDPPALSAHLATVAPLWTPVPDGTSGYHPLTWGYLAGEIVQRLMGQSLGTVLSERFTHTAPSKIDFWLGLPEAEHSRVADLMRPREMPKLGDLTDIKKAAFLTKWAAPDRGGKIWREIEIPSANGHGTAQSVAEIYGSFANGGFLGAESIADDDTWNDFLKMRVTGPDRVLPFDISFASGVMKNDQGIYGPSKAAFGHSGWGGSAAFGDPETGLSCAYVMNRQSAHLQGDPRAKRLFSSTYRAIM